MITVRAEGPPPLPPPGGERIDDNEYYRTAKQGKMLRPCSVPPPPFLLGCATPTTLEGTSRMVGSACAKPLLTSVYYDGDDAQHLPQNAKALRIAHLCRTAERRTGDGKVREQKDGNGRTCRSRAIYPEAGIPTRVLLPSCCRPAWVLLPSYSLSTGVLLAPCLREQAEKQAKKAGKQAIPAGSKARRKNFGPGQRDIHRRQRKNERKMKAEE